MTCRSLLFKGYFYDSYTNLCVRVVKQSKTQAQAARACAVDGASLMIVDDSTKQDYLIYWIFSHRGKYTVNSRYLKVEVNPKLLISQSKFSGPRKFTLRYQ